jgi:hypothetical protein
MTAKTYNSQRQLQAPTTNRNNQQRLQIAKTLEQPKLTTTESNCIDAEQLQTMANVLSDSLTLREGDVYEQCG